jgi:hypothetical protein
MPYAAILIHNLHPVRRSLEPPPAARHLDGGQLVVKNGLIIVGRRCIQEVFTMLQLILFPSAPGIRRYVNPCFCPLTAFSLLSEARHQDKLWCHEGMKVIDAA